MIRISCCSILLLELILYISVRCVCPRKGAGKACDASHSGATRKECNAASALSRENPSGTSCLGVLLRCAVCQGSHPWRHDAPCTTSQTGSFALTDMYEMSSSHGRAAASRQSRVK